MHYKILVLHGPNLNLLGKREKDIYGEVTLDEINKELIEFGKEEGFEIITFQSNYEGELITKIQDAKDKVDGIIINPAAYTHTSIAIRDALLAVNLPTIEVHLSNIFKREEFRRKSYISDIAIGVISGFGKLSYILALKAMIEILKK